MASLTSFFFPDCMIIATVGCSYELCKGHWGYDPDTEFERANWEENEGLLPTTTTTGIQGIVYCNSGSEQIPLEGALVRIRCVAVHDHGYETAPFSILSDATDHEGYFFSTFSASEVEDNWKLTLQDIP